MGIIIAYPYAGMLDLREQTRFPFDSVHGVLSPEDISTLESSPTLPMAVVEMLTQLIERDVKSNVDAFTTNALFRAAESLLVPVKESNKVLLY